jgi:hypothetical protein
VIRSQSTTLDDTSSNRYKLRFGDSYRDIFGGSPEAPRTQTLVPFRMACMSS